MRIGLLTSSINSSYGQALIRGLWRELEARNCTLLIFEGYSLVNNTVSDYQCNALFRLISQGRIDALILSASQLSSKAGIELIQAFAARVNIPVVSLGAELDGIPSVITDNFSGFEQIVSHLISHHYKKLAHISGPLKNPEALLRRDAFLKGVYKTGLEVPKHFILEGNFSYISGYNLTKKLISPIKAKEIDAIVCTNDETAFGAMRCLIDNGIAVPKDVAITGFDDVRNSLGNIQTALTTVSQPFDQMGQQAIKALMNKQQKGTEDQTHIIEPHLVIRNSCGCKEQDKPDSGDYSSPSFNHFISKERFRSLDETNFHTVLTDCLIEYGMKSCYIVRFLESTRFDDYASARQNMKGKLTYGFSGGRRTYYTKPFDVAQILPDAAIGSLEDITFLGLLFVGNNQFGYLVMSASEELVPFLAELCVDVKNHIENDYLSHEKQQVEKKLSDTLERLISTNRKLNELTVRDNLDKMDRIRHLANNMLQHRKIGSGEYYLVLVEIDRFFEINMEYGFEEGEYIMNLVTNILSGSIREDDFLSHQNCERYMIVLKHFQGDVIKTIERRFHAKLKELNASHDKPYTISFSWGHAHAGINSDFEQVYLKAEAHLNLKRNSPMD